RRAWTLLAEQPLRRHCRMIDGGQQGDKAILGTRYAFMNILLIDDEASLRRTMRTALETMGHQVSEAKDRTQALELLGHRLFDLAFLDLRLTREAGLELLPELLRLAPGLDVIIMTAYATIETAVEAMRRGAFDYLPKPFTPDQLRLLLGRITQVRHLQS